MGCTGRDVLNDTGYQQSEALASRCVLTCNSRKTFGLFSTKRQPDPLGDAGADYSVLDFSRFDLVD